MTSIYADIRLSYGDKEMVLYHCTGSISRFNVMHWSFPVIVRRTLEQRLYWR